MKPNHLRVSLRAMGSLVAGGLLVSCLEPADQIMERHGQARIVFVKEPSVGGMNQNRASAMAANPDEFHPGTDLVSLSPISPTGTVTNLTEQWTRARPNESEWGAALDPEASFDGTKILFSMRKSGPREERPRFAIYEMNADGTNLVQLTAPAGYDDMDPAYIDETHIVFGSTINQVRDEYERRIVPQLFVGERGPKGFLINVRQITFNQSHDQNPFVHSSGKVFYTRWDHLGGPNKMPLFTVNPDGTGQFVLYGADETFAQGMGSGSRTFMEARELSDGGIVASLMERASDFEGGAICIVDLSKFTSPPQIITPSTSPYNNTQKTSQAIFKTPYPIMDGGVEKILVAESANETGGDIDGKVNYDLFIIEKTGGTPRLVHADPDYNDYDPVVLAPRTLPVRPYAMNPLVQKAIAENVKTGMFFDANVYSRQSDGQLRGADLDGKVKFVRVLAAVSTPANCDFCGQSMGNTEFERQRVVGYADVRADSSFSIEVPANTPMHVQTLDENGMMLVNQLQWINVMPGEQRMCTGCHGVREKDADITHFAIDQTDASVSFDLGAVKRYLSGFANAQKVDAHPSARGAITNFYTLRDTSAAANAGTVQSILDNRCISCHGASEAAAKGGGLVLENQPDTALTNHGTTSVYERLTAGNGYVTGVAGQKINYATDNGARQSPLAWVLFNKQSGGGKGQFRQPSYDHSAIWQKDSASGRIDVFAAGNADLLTLVEWMDMGVQFMNSVPKK
ncbi:MAG: hypothetical protein JWP91_1190 [Fibrobacteres bacterium]|nr:hypothetical protein [Fibrobacterota bacterium]